MMLKSGLFLGLTLIALAMSATFNPEDALQRVRTWITREFKEQNVSDSDKILTHIFRVEVKASGSKPRRINLDVEGEHPDGCEYPVIVDQSRSDNVVDIQVYREVPADVVCPMILKPYRDSISVEGSFEPGEYTINVNSHSQAVSI
ncbi:MAG: hypothetical protein OXG68_09165 [Chloroflexi bacterium]|nr:hypothetical protein [Chloroflexota bacterium]